jgi:DnaK suppressor protein
MTDMGSGDTPDTGSVAEPIPTGPAAPGTVTPEPEAAARLAGEREHLAERLGELGADEAQLSADDSFADSAQVAAEQGENRALAAELRDQLNDVERAIAKLDDGTYGQCEVCGQPIGDTRLEAMPAARFCIDHASA